MTWYGERAAWWMPFERDSRRRYGPALQHTYGPGRLAYLLDGLDVIGDRKPVTVVVLFYAAPPYPCYGQEPQDFPRVYAKLGASSPHRHPDGALCLWYPWDPPDRRWHSDNGLADLIAITRRHLFLENHWRTTDQWVIEDAPHGIRKAS